MYAFVQAVTAKKAKRQRVIFRPLGPAQGWVHSICPRQAVRVGRRRRGMLLGRVLTRECLEWRADQAEG